MHKLICLLALLAGLTCRAYTRDTPADIKKFVIEFSETLTHDQEHLAMLGFDDSARQTWNNLPVGLRPRRGLATGSMNADQLILLHRILSASLSSQGYLKATGIMHLDNLLNDYYDTLHNRKSIPDSLYQFLRSLSWGTQQYYFAIFGNPEKDSVWSYKLEGHHLSINFTFHGKGLSVTPMFVGTDPAQMPDTQYAGWRVLGQEEDLGMKLIDVLTPEQRKKATMSGNAPTDIITAAESGKRLIDYWGIKGSELNKQQLEVLARIVREFVFNLEYGKAVEEYAKIEKAGMGNIYFGWIGAYEEFKPHYFVLNGPTFLIEFDNNGGPRRSANHIHAIWREKGNEYGDDVLKRHYQQEHHQH
jgi:hypothetical protein